MEHVDYPHEPGRMYACPACEDRCFCEVEEHDESCDHPMSDGHLYHVTRCVHCDLNEAGIAPLGGTHA